MPRLAQSTFMVAVAGLTLAPTCTPPAEQAQAAPAATEPRVRLRLSGAMQGRLEPCGCAAAQLGGLPRRVFHLRQDKEFDLLLEGGNLVTGGTPLDSMKLMTALSLLAMPQSEYHAIGVGPNELDLPLEELAAYTSAFPFVCSDLASPEGSPWAVPTHLDLQAGEVSVRVGALALSVPEPAAARLELVPPAAAWSAAMAGVPSDALRILLVHGSPADVRAQAALQPAPDLVVGVCAEIAEPPPALEPGNPVPVVFVGTRGRMLLDVTLTRKDDAPVVTRYRVIRLQGSETAKGALEDRDAKLALLAHRQMVAEGGVLEQMAGVIPTENGAHYVGNDACVDCHEDAVEVWKTTAHAHAWRTLEEAEQGDRYGWPVTRYPDCVRCHTVGYGYESGFVNPKQTPRLADVGCEQCHGPGSKHIEDGDPTLIERSDHNTCLTCHDLEQSPDFGANYAERWQAIKH